MTSAVLAFFVRWIARRVPCLASPFAGMARVCGCIINLVKLAILGIRAIGITGIFQHLQKLLRQTVFQQTFQF